MDHGSNILSLLSLSQITNYQLLHNNMIPEESIEYVANLARMGISEDEKKKYFKQISELFKYFEELKMIDLRNVEPTSQITGLQNVTREDEVHLIHSEEKVLDEAPEVEGEQVRVPGVMRGKK